MSKVKFDVNPYTFRVVAENSNSVFKFRDTLTSRAEIGDLSAKLEEDTKIAIDKRNILLQDPIKELGESSVTLKVGFQTTVDITIAVVPLEETEEA